MSDELSVWRGTNGDLFKNGSHPRSLLACEMTD